MTAALRYWAIIPAAGTSQRMNHAVGEQTPKQFLPLGTTTVIEASLSCFLNHPKISGIIVVLNADDRHWDNLDLTGNEKIHVVVGGKTRAESVQNAVTYLDNMPVKENDFILVHDAARPCLRYGDLETLIAELKEEEVGGILAAPVSDTLKLVDVRNQNGSLVTKTLDRSNIWRAFTPQMFRFKYLKKALNHCEKNSIPVTDEASAIEILDLPVKLIQGHSDNIKITRKEDLQLAEVILNKIITND